MASTSRQAERVELQRTALPDDPTREMVLYRITMPQGAAAPVHTHPGIGLGYVLEGVYESQYEGEDLKTFHPGDPIYDLAETPHLIARNLDPDNPLVFVMTFVVKKGEPTVRIP